MTLFDPGYAFTGVIVAKARAALPLGDRMVMG
jgi:hypothetical protein